MVYMRLNSGSLRCKTPAEIAGGGLTIGWIAWEGGGVDTFQDPHVGCAKAAPYCVFSSQDSDKSNMPVSPSATSFAHNNAHQSVIAVVRGVNLEVRQIAYSRSPLFSNDTYWA